MAAKEALYYNATFHTGDTREPIVDAILVRGERIAATGSRSDLESAVGPGARFVDLDGRTVVPGFNDCHCHVLGFGLELERIDVSAGAVKGIPDIQRAVSVRARQTRRDDWVLGRGYDQNMLVEGRHPTAADLDESAGGRPVALWHTSGHVLTCSSVALTLAGITRDTQDPPGGAIDRDDHGTPTGVLKESAMELLASVIPPPSHAQGVEAIARATALMASFGITSATDAATGHGHSITPELAMYREVAFSNAPKVRLSLLPQILYVAPPESDEYHRVEEFDVGDRPDWLRLSGTKIFSDGALSTRTAAMRQPYDGDPNNEGILLWEPSTLLAMMRRAHAAGWQIATHALGDRAVELVVACYEKTTQGARLGDRRHRIEHCMVCDEELGKRILDLGVVPVLQPDIFRLGDGYIAALGVARAEEVIPMHIFQTLGIPVAFSSDAPVVPCDPLLNIRSAVERVTPGGVTLGRHHAMTVMESIRLYTAGGAFATHSEKEKGKLVPGMLADFAVLSLDPAATPVDEFDGLYVNMTVAGGRPTYER